MTANRCDAEYKAAYWEANKDRINRERREKYRTDPKVRAKKIKASREYRDENAEETNRARRARYATDPEYRKRISRAKVTDSGTTESENS